jgi:hypothetical protein
VTRPQRGRRHTFLERMVCLRSLRELVTPHFLPLYFKFS